MTGTIARLMPETNYGFLEPDDSRDAPQVFFHRHDCVCGFDHLRVGQRVSFEIGVNRRTGRPLARHVTLDATYDGRSGCR